jgi:hypothetical protein
MAYGLAKALPRPDSYRIAFERCTAQTVDHPVALRVDVLYDDLVNVLGPNGPR